MKIVFATHNKGKLREVREILGEGFEIVSPDDLGHSEDIEETGNTLAANSLLKAKYIVDTLGVDCFADDSALEVEILAGRPGVHTARYAPGEGHDSQANMDKLLVDMACREMEASMAREFGLTTVHATRRARFRTVATLILDGHIHTFEGILNGKISLVKKGDGGFGYDPVFIPERIPQWACPALPEGSSFTLESDGEGLVANWSQLTLAQLGEEAKNAISHRGKATRALAKFLLEEAAKDSTETTPKD